MKYALAFQPLPIYIFFKLDCYIPTPFTSTVIYGLVYDIYTQALLCTIGLIVGKHSLLAGPDLIKDVQLTHVSYFALLSFYCCDGFFACSFADSSRHATATNTLKDKKLFKINSD